ncbi:ribosomal protein S18-alanine N-acetyltransferase [Nocardioides montaniterrae]
MKVRLAVVGDLAAVAAAEAASFPEDAWTENLLAQGVAGELPTVSYWLLEEDGRLLGHAVVSVAGEDAELQRIAIAAGERRRGLGRRLLDGCVTEARERGAERMTLEVREDNVAAQALYLEAGFTEIARRPRYYRDGSTAVVMQRSVRMDP